MRVLILFLFISCSQRPPQNLETIGHWHIYNPKLQFDNYYNILDSENGIDAKLNKRYTDIELSVRSESNVIIENGIIYNLWLDEYFQNFNYLVRNDTMFLSSRKDSLAKQYEFIGFRREITKCDKELDFYSNSLLAIELPATNKQGENFFSANYKNTLELYYGRNKYNNNFDFVLNHSVFELKFLNLQLEKFKVKRPREWDDKLTLILNLDRNMLDSLKNQLIFSVNKLNFKKIFQRKIGPNGNIVLMELE